MNNLIKIFSVALFSFFLLFFLISCNKDVNTTLPVAQFTASKDTVPIGEPVTFTVTNPEEYCYYKWTNSESEYPNDNYTESASSYSAAFGDNGTFTIKLLVVNESGGDSCSVDIVVGNYGIIKCTGTITFDGEPSYCIIKLYQNYSEDIILNISPSLFTESAGYYRYNYDVDVNLSTLVNVDPQGTLSFRIVGKRVLDYYESINYTNFTPDNNNEFNYSCTFD